ncbi:MAG: T9SS type A sorting domain-containing protein [Bacteroidetes bacterium]|nr:T9SS type A sorting domain-containing protein [Bacteroidota bacterium]
MTAGPVVLLVVAMICLSFSMQPQAHGQESLTASGVRGGGTVSVVTEWFPAPAVRYTELDRRVAIEWGSNLPRVDSLEHGLKPPFAYLFAGYNIYQLPSPDATLQSAKKIANYYVTYGDPCPPRVIYDLIYDAEYGIILTLPVQIGITPEIHRWFVFDRDYLNGKQLLTNGTAYHVAVTAYYWSSTGDYPAAAESSPIVYTVRPQSERFYSLNPGEVLPGVVQTQALGVAPSDGRLEVVVVDPGRVTGHTYTVEFTPGDSGFVWSLRDLTQGTVLLSDQTNQSGDVNYSITDGLMVKVIDSEPGMKDYQIPAGRCEWTWASADIGAEGFGGAIGNAYDNFPSRSTVTYDKLRNVLLRFAETDSAGNAIDTTDPDHSSGYRYLRGADQPAARPGFAPFITHPESGYAYQTFERNIPIAAYNVDVSPPVRLAVGFLENNVPAGLVDGKYWPGIATVYPDNISSSGPLEWLFVFDKPYSDLPDTTLQVDLLADATPMMWLMTVRNKYAGGYQPNSELLIRASHLNVPGVTYQFSVPQATSVREEWLVRDCRLEQNFPNPFNPTTTIRFALPRIQHVNLSVFNVLGQRVAVLEDGVRGAGLHEYTFDGDGLASGIYLYRLTAGVQSITKKLMLLR